MSHICLVICFFCCAVMMPLAAAQTAPDPKPSKDPAWTQAGKADAKQAFARQAATAVKPTGDTPGFVGLYLWGGRADENYLPFHMWELRLRAGKAALSNLRCRITTLTQTRQIQKQGSWKNLGNLAANGALDFDYRLGGPIFNVYQVELLWQNDKAESKETYLAWDRFTPPVVVSQFANSSYLLVINQNFDYDAAKRTAAVSYVLWNIGGQAGHDVLQTIHFKDKMDKDVATFDFAPEKGVVPAGLVKEQRITAPKIPAFVNISITSRLSDHTTSLDPGTFTSAKDVEIAKVRAEGKMLKARVRNGTGSDLIGVVVTIALQDKNSTVIKSFDLSVGALTKGEERDISAELTGVPPWSGYEVGWKSSDTPALTTSPVINQSLTVEGVEFTISSTKADKKGLNIIGTVSNRRDADIEGLAITFAAPDLDVSGKKVFVELTVGRLAQDADTELSFILIGVKTFTGLVMSWKSVTDQTKK